jgi:ABC-type nitrate/sulfonate/bicarbonate transport system ATPase subunit
VGEAIFIFDRVIAMTRRPGRVKREIEAVTQKPRDYEFVSSTEFTGLERKLAVVVQSEVEGMNLSNCPGSYRFTVSCGFSRVGVVASN